MIKEAFEQGFIKRAKEVAQEQGLTHEEFFKLLGSEEAYKRQKKTPGSDIFFGPHIKDINEREYKMRQGYNRDGAGLLGMLLGATAGGITGGVAGDDYHAALAGVGLGSGIGGLLGAGAGHLATSRRIPSSAKFLDKDYSNAKRA